MTSPEGNESERQNEPLRGGGETEEYMKDPEKNVALLEREEEAHEAEAVAEKPEISEEIMIEEINIDGMCGVY